MTPLVLAPGLLCDAALWQPQIAHFSQERPVQVADTTQDDTIAGMAARLLADAPERFALAGLSMGGYVSLEVMRRAPERVERLALLDTSPRPETDEGAKARRLLMNMAEAGTFRGVTTRLLPRLVHPSRLEDEALTRIVVEMALNIGKDAYLRQQTAIMNRVDSRPDLIRIGCPTLVLVGHEDILTPPNISAEMAADILNAKLVVVPECGHLSTLERPEAVNAAMDAWFRRE
jgi:pimeloyl-ACP methyl ester carboxylesterase